MLLERAHVTNFRSAMDTGEFAISRVTCLVGKNEAGKSAVLMALAALNPHSATPAVLDRERDYPRASLLKYDELHSSAAAVAISTNWKLEGSDLATIALAIGPGAFRGDRVEVSRSYGEAPEFQFELDFGVVLKFLYAKHNLDESEVAVLSTAGTTSTLIETLNGMTVLSERQQSLKADLAKNGAATGRVKAILAKRLPKFMYFSSYDRMDGAIQIEQTRQLIANDTIDNDAHRGQKLFAEFLEYAGVSIDEIAGVQTYETFNAKLQAASNNITDQILEYWTQNPDLNVAVRVEQARPGDPAPFNSGTIARARIENRLHRVDTPFSERSAGFVWFFSFLVKFAQVKDETSPVVLLLDEPGLTLHGKAQADLLRFFAEKLAPHHQIIYSTHSPFMVPADDLSSVRIVEDQVELKGPRRVPIGTKVREDVLGRDPDTVFPLQGALGYEISQSLFVGKNTLLVEGPGDILYLQALSDALNRRQRTGLDPRWVLCPAGGIDKIRPFVSLFGANQLNVAALSDEAKGDKRKIEDLKRGDVLKAGHFYSIADFVDASEADIEDLFDPSIFVSIVNAAFQVPEGHLLTAKTLDEADQNTTRLLKKAEAAFNVLPETVPTFDHFTPAAWLIRNPKVLEGKSPAVTKTLERAEKVFATFNALLP